MRTLHTIPLLFALTAASAQVNRAKELVNPFVGTGGHGHTFPGACVPFGLVQLSPDTRPEGYMDWDGCSGYHYSDSVIYGFSHTHLSGTGVADLCDVLLMPMSRQPSAADFAANERPWSSHFSHSRESAHAGYYRVHLDDPDVEAEMTATTRTGLHRYTWPKAAEQVLVLDLKHRDELLDGSITQVSKTEITGNRRSSSWAKDQQLFFCIRTNKPMFPSTTPLPGDPPPSRTPGKKTRQVFLCGASDGTPLIVKVGISAVSIEGARRNLEEEIPDWDFDAVKGRAEDTWNKQLGKIDVTGGSPEAQRNYYTALYHACIAPYTFNDVDGQYRGMDGQVHHADHPVYTVFSLWDTFRALHPLMTIIEPERTNDFIRTFLLNYQQGGRLPVWELWGNETDCMIGYHSVSVIADAYMKGIRGYDAELALTAMVASAMGNTPGLEAYRTKGYISSEDESESVSKTLEYAYDDWCIARLAEAMGRDSLAKVFYDRSRNWQNLFDPETHFFRARYNGGFVRSFDPYEVNFNYTEANAWQYSLFVPHDLLKFSELWGSGLYAQLNELFTTTSATTGRDQSDITGMIGQYAHGNEPSHHMAYLFRGGKGYDLIRRILTQLYHDRPDGLAGNEDCGQMSAWYVMSAMGLYPVAPGCVRYWTGITLFDEVTVHLPNGKDVHIHQRSMTDNRSAAAEPQPWPSIAHADLVKGMNLSLADGPRADPARTTSPFRSDLNVPPAAIITAPSPVFKEPFQAVITCLPGPWHLQAAVEQGRWMDAKADPFRMVLDVDRTTTITARTVDEHGRLGPGITAHFTRIDGDRSVQLESSYANQYSASGPQALVDGLGGGADFRTGDWQGFEGQDLLATVDLGGVKKLMRAGIGVLQDENSWIWYPSEVTFAWSTNGRAWSSATVTNTVDRKAKGGQVQELWTGEIGKKARYVKVIAKNAGPCPDWHPGKGGRTWIFADEILTETE